MKIFQNEPENEKNQENQELKKKLDSFETILSELRHIIGYRRTMLKNADKTLQEFQDTMYAMLMEAEHPRKKYKSKGKQEKSAL